MAGKRIDETTKLKVIRDHTNRVSRKKIEERFGISLSSVNRIVKEKGLQDSQENTIQTNGKTEKQKRIDNFEKRVAQLEKKILEVEVKIVAASKHDLH